MHIWRPDTDRVYYIIRVVYFFLNLCESFLSLTPLANLFHLPSSLSLSHSRFLVPTYSFFALSATHCPFSHSLFQALLSRTGAAPAQLLPLLDDTMQLALDAFDALIEVCVCV